MTVDQRGLAVSVPWKTPERRVTAFVEEHADWVLRKLEAWSRHPARRAAWASGDVLHFVGRQLRLEVAPGPVALARLDEGDRLCLELPAGAPVREAVVQWYRGHAQANFRERIALLAPRLGVPAPRLFLSSARTRWGSCNVRGDVRLNWRLVQAPQPTIDYVVVHELAHLIEMNHSRRFWKLVAGACPQYADARAELDRMGPYYMDI
ncbi:MAG TPA: SprT family zinc-dependent metalloprotease [Burkholderiales bacterium]|nr:SprT family zinc-dependent metalloprotease [Burkholderiales bacterium]